MTPRPRCVHRPFPALLVGCTVGPDYRRPEVTVPPTWRQADQPGVSPGVTVVTAWWQTFQDPVLDRLVQQAVAANLDLKVATARVREARALRGVTAADRVPSVNASGTAARVRDSENFQPRPPGFEFEHDFFLVGMDASSGARFLGAGPPLGRGGGRHRGGDRGRAA